jgi:uncharacterized radical SAM protein YgiQ
MDSMINHYTANKKRRNDDAYSPGGRTGLRPDRPTRVYTQRCREAFPGVPVVIGGIEASLRRIAHFDYWSEQVRPSMLAASKADLLAFGKGEATIVTVARALAAGEPVAALRDLRGVAYLLGAREARPAWPDETLGRRPRPRSSRPARGPGGPPVRAAGGGGGTVIASPDCMACVVRDCLRRRPAAAARPTS